MLKFKILPCAGLSGEPETDPYLRILTQAHQGWPTYPDQCTDAGLVRREFDRLLHTGHVITPRIHRWSCFVGISFFAHRRLMVRK